MREFLMLAHVYTDQSIDGWYGSEKLDGQRAFWDGGITKGIKASDVCFANTAKDDRYVDEVIATGLWSRYGKVIRAPDWFLEHLPPVPLDGELYLGRGKFQDLCSITRSHEGHWSNVKYLVFDTPPLTSVFCDGHVKAGIHFDKVFTGVYNKIKKLIPDNPLFNIQEYTPFYDRIYKLRNRTKENDIYKVHEHKEIDWRVAEAWCMDIVAGGGEGLVLRKPESLWEPKRSKYLLKYKPYDDAEAKVLGYTDGKGRHIGRLGALIVEFQGKQFEIGSGFTDNERDTYKELYPVGSFITFKYRKFTDAGIPFEARYWRKYEY